MSLAVIATTFALIFLAELPDKTALASLVLATRYPGRYVFLGAAVGFTVQVAIAVAAGSLLRLLPHRVLEAVVATLFLIGAGLMLWQSRGADAQEEPEIKQVSSPWRAMLVSFSVITVAEFGDLTQIVTANLAAKYNWLSVSIGALLALWAVAALAILGGQALLRWIPLKLVIRAAAAIMLVLAGISLYSVFA
ncbi:TMEM165/GDT1 family protein [Actinospica durhamensis]|uniref:GDT1 family protein n=1 Tax=Actinospica durhamensis TaxID=1508375 RepID=A0A941EVU8_9ACTN|nr:TMEM165/GDT1 family protein [Actinospica durhamensis]MBR7839225.1 TMEM165/GDT1 family protein [Actinospica durhamensis]